MSEFVAGLVAGTVIVFLIWVAYLEIRVQLLSEKLKSINEKQEVANAVKAISGLSSAELDALVAKDVGGSTKPS